MINIKEDARLSVLNHSCAHLMAQAVKRLYPQAQFWVGPVITEGFYYDIDLKDDVIKEEDLPAIEKEMKKISKDGKRIIRIELSKDEALEMFKNDSYKLDLINNMDESSTVISAYKQGEFIDLCRGPHVETVKEIKFFKLLKVSGAYWKGDAANKMLQRIYGICFDSQEALDDYLNFLEEAKKRDHKKLGKELGIFMMSEYGPGFPFFLNNGMIIRNELENYWYQEHTLEKYQFIKTPQMLNKELWELSGHWDNYRENMYISEVDDKVFVLKPMNCPGSMLVYKNNLYSYRDFPLRLGELGSVHRHEASGALNGLFRVRNFTQDDAHIFLSEDQLESEILNIMRLIDRIYKVFGLTYRIELSTRPEKYIGDEEVWMKSETALMEACKKSGQEYRINEGDGAFYGPKLDFHVRDSLGREWQCATVQVDMNLPLRFDCHYIAQDGSKKTPIVVHRVVFGAIERFMGILIEHYAGAFPLWLAPVQVAIIPVNNTIHSSYSEEITKILEAEGIRVELDNRDEKLGYRMREALMKKIPYQIVIGDQEIETKELNIRQYGREGQRKLILNELIKELQSKIEIKSLE